MTFLERKNRVLGTESTLLAILALASSFEYDPT